MLEKYLKKAKQWCVLSAESDRLVIEFQKGSLECRLQTEIKAAGEFPLVLDAEKLLQLPDIDFVSLGSTAIARKDNEPILLKQENPPLVKPEFLLRRHMPTVSIPISDRQAKILSRMAAIAEQAWDDLKEQASVQKVLNQGIRIKSGLVFEQEGTTLVVWALGDRIACRYELKEMDRQFSRRIVPAELLANLEGEGVLGFGESLISFQSAGLTMAAAYFEEASKVPTDMPDMAGGVAFVVSRSELSGILGTELATLRLECQGENVFVNGVPALKLGDVEAVGQFSFKRKDLSNVSATLEDEIFSFCIPSKKINAYSGACIATGDGRLKFYFADAQVKHPKVKLGSSNIRMFSPGAWK